MVRARAVYASQKGNQAGRPDLACRRITLQAPPVSTWLNPGESITLTTAADTPARDGKYIVAPHPEAKISTTEWISTKTHELSGGAITITNDSTVIQKISANDNVAQSFAVVHPDHIDPMITKPLPKKLEKTH